MPKNETPAVSILMPASMLAMPHHSPVDRDPDHVPEFDNARRPIVETHGAGKRGSRCADATTIRFYVKCG
jgi:hypothetical protein